jgi:hypothetical protein
MVATLSNNSGIRHKDMSRPSLTRESLRDISLSFANADFLRQQGYSGGEYPPPHPPPSPQPPLGYHRPPSHSPQPPYNDGYKVCCLSIRILKQEC